jgi:hypothetical protein
MNINEIIQKYMDMDIDEGYLADVSYRVRHPIKTIKRVASDTEKAVKQETAVGNKINKKYNDDLHRDEKIETLRNANDDLRDKWEEADATGKAALMQKIKTNKDKIRALRNS